MKQIILTLLLALQLFQLSAQEKVDTAFAFRFVPHKNIFYVPFRGNDTEPERLYWTLKDNASSLQAGQMYISVSSYAASSTPDMCATRTSYLRICQVKS